MNVGFDGILPAYLRFDQRLLRLGLHQRVVRNAAAQYPGAYLPSHTTFDLSVGKTFGEKYTVSVNALNVANRRVQLDNSLTFGGFHWNDPRQIYGEFRYRFNY